MLRKEYERRRELRNSYPDLLEVEEKTEEPGKECLRTSCNRNKEDKVCVSDVPNETLESLGKKKPSCNLKKTEVEI